MSIVKRPQLDPTTNAQRRARAFAMRPVLLCIVATLCWPLPCAKGLQGGEVVDVKLVRDASVSEQKILAVIELRPADPTVWVSSEPELLSVLEQSPVEDIYAALEAFELNNAAPQEYTEMVSDMPPPAAQGEAFDKSEKLPSKVASPTKLLQIGDAAVPSLSDSEKAAAKTIKPIAQPAEFSENSQLEIVFAGDDPEPLKRGPKREKKTSVVFDQDPIDLFLAADDDSAKPADKPEHALLEEYSSPVIEPQKSNADSKVSSVQKQEVEDPIFETPRKVGVGSRMLSQMSSDRGRESSPKRLPTPPQVSGSSQQGLMSQWTTLQTTAPSVYPMTSTPSEPIPQRASAAPAYPATAVARNNPPQPTGIAPPSPELLIQRIQLPRLATTRPETTAVQTSAKNVPTAPVAIAAMPRSEMRLPAATRTSFVEEPRTSTANSGNNRPWFLQHFYASRAGQPEAKPNTKSKQSRHSSVARNETLEDPPSLVRQLFGMPGQQATNPAPARRTQEAVRAVPQVQPAAAQLKTSNAPIKKTSGDQLLEILSEFERIGEPRQMVPQRQRKLLKQSVTQLTPAEDTLVAGAEPPLATEADAWETLNGVELATFVEPLAFSSDETTDLGTGYVTTAAYFQTPAPTENAQREIGEEVPPPTGQGQAPADTIAGAETLGEEPVDNSLQFLRTATVLLEPGQTQFDYGLTYLLFETDFPILVSDGESTTVDEAFFKQREMVVPFELRVGVLERLQAFLSVPVGWANTQISFDGFDAFENDGGLGDITAGGTFQLRDETPDCPAIITTLAVTAPTGQEPFLPVGLAPESATLGNGFWAISGSVLFIQTWDPLVLFYGVGTRQSFERDLFGFEVKPGGEYNYTLGVGFAVNDRVTLSTRFAGTYVEEVSLNGQRVPGTIQEPMTLRFAATIARKECLTEPFVEFGTTDDAVSSYFGVVWTH